MKCKHCWSQSEQALKEREITGEDFVSAIARLLPLRPTTVVISGGEPLLHFEKVKRICWYCVNHYMLVDLETNGTVLSKDMINALGDYLDQVSVSLDFLDETDCEEFRGLKGSYNRALNGIKLLVRKGVNTQVIMSVYSENLPHIKKLAKFVLEDLCATSFKIGPIIPRGRAKINLKDKLLSSKQIIDLATIINELIERYPGRIVPDIPHALIKTMANWLMRKRDCENALAIFPNGDISLCSGFFGTNMIFGNTRDISTREVWERNPKLRAIRESLRIDCLRGICRICIFKRYCKGYCPAYSYEVYGKLSPFPICQQLYEESLFPPEMIID